MVSIVRDSRTWFLRRYAAVFVTLTVIVSAVAYGFLMAQRDALVSAAVAELQVVSTLKVGQIGRWRAERLGDAATMRSALVAQEIAAWAASPAGDGGRDARVRSYLASLRDAYGYRTVAVVDGDGLVVGATGGAGLRLGERERGLVGAAFGADAPCFSDLYLTDAGEPAIALATPVTAAGGAGAPRVSVFFVLDPGRYLFPLIQEWPGPSASAETLLVRKDGDDVLFLNQLRHRADTALRLRFRLTDTPALPAAQAVTGRAGPAEGFDYRGVRVIGFLAAVPGTNWALVTKIDRSEVLAGFTRHAIEVAIVVAALIAALGAGLLVLVGRQRRRDDAAVRAELQRQVSERTEELVAAREERARAETALEFAEQIRQSEERFRLSFEFAPLGIAHTGVDGRLLRVNRAFCDMLGYSEQELTSGTFTPITHPDDVEASRTLIRDLVAGVAASRQIEKRYLAKDGRVVWALVSSFLLRDRDGQPLHFVTQIADITSRKEAEASLRASEAQFRSLFEHTSVGMVLVSAEGRFLRLNGSFCAQTGYGEEELLGRHFGEITHPDDAPRDNALVGRLLAGDQLTFDVEKRYLRKDGSPTWARTFVTLVRKPDGSPSHFLAVVQDINQRRLVEDELRLKDSVFRSSLTADSIGSNDGLLTHVNETFLRTWGYDTADEVIGRPIPDFLADLSVTGEILDALRATGTWEGEYLARRKDGSTFLAQSKANVVRGADGRQVALYSSVIDITERRAIEDRFRVAAESLSDIIYEWDLGERIEWFGDVDSLMGFAAGEFPRTLDAWRALLHPDDCDRVMAAVGRQLAGGAPYETEYRIRRNDGRYAWWTARGAVKRDGHGVPAKWIGTVTDVTARKAAEEAVRAAEARYRQVVESSPLGMHFYRLEDDGRLVFTGANPAAEAILGFDHGPLEGKTVEEAFPGLVGTEVPERYRTVARGGWPWSGEEVTYHDEKIAAAFEVTAFSIAPMTMVATFVDVTERNRAEAAARAADQRRALFVEQSPLAVIEWNLDFTVAAWNPAAERVFGYTPTEAIGRHAADIILPAAARPHVDAVWRELLAQRGGTRSSNENLTRDGRIITCEWFNAPLVDADGTVVGAASLVLDVTEQRRAEAALEAAKEYAERLIETANAMIVGLDVHGDVTVFNQAAVDITGYEKDELQGRNWFEVLVPRDRYPEVWAAFSRLLQGGLPKRFENPIVTKAGEERYILWQNNELFDGGAIAGSISFGIDITNLKRAEEETQRLLATVAEERERLAVLVDSIADEVWFADEKARFTLANPKALAEFRLAPDDHVDVEKLATSLEVLRADGSLRPVEEAPPLRALAGELVRNQEEIVRTPATGELRHRLVSASPVRDRSGTIIGSVSVVRDVTELKHAEAEVAKSAERFRAIFENNSAAIAIIEPDTTISMVNDAYCEMSGYPRDEVVGMSWTKQIPPEDLERLKAYNRLRLANPEAAPDKYEFSFCRKDGERRYGLMSVSLIPSLGKIITSFIDITDRKRAEEAARREEALTRTIIDSIPGTFYMLDADGRYVRWNAYQRDEIVGKPEDQVATTNAIDTIHPDDRALIAARIASVLGTGQQETVEGRVLLRGGPEFRWLLMTGRQIVAEGKPYLIGTGIDITDRRRADEALRASEERLRRFYESDLLGVIYWNMDGEITDANDRFLAMVGYSRADLEHGAIDWLAMTPPEFRHLDAQSVAELVATGVNRKPFEKEYVRKDGSRLPILIAGAMLDEARHDGVAFVLDISERKVAEERLTTAVAELERSNRELEQFAFISSHDLQEPLRMVASYVQLLSRRYRGRLDAEADEFIGFASEGAERMQQLINDLLAYSRVGTRGRPPEPTDTAAVVASACANLRLTIEESGANVTHGDLPIVRADEVQLVQLFQNLIGNAIKFRGAEPPEIRVEAQGVGGEWQFVVRDNGIGISPSHFDRIFKVFQRLHSRTEYPGTGIGLAICKKIVERLGGRIWVESAPGAGSSFFFTIPMRRGDVQ